MEHIKTARTYLRRWEKDLNILFDILGSKEVMDPVGGGTLTLDEVKALFQRFLESYEKYNFGPMAVVLAETNEIIGFNGIKQLKNLEHPDIGFAFLKKYWRQGFGEETSRAVIDHSFQVLNLKTLLALVDSKNTASIHLLKKLGFVFKNTIIFKGDPTDVYELLKL